MEAESEMRAIAEVLNEKIFRRLGFEAKADRMYEPGGCFAFLNLERCKPYARGFVCELLRSSLWHKEERAWEELLKTYSSGRYVIGVPAVGRLEFNDI